MKLANQIAAELILELGLQRENQNSQDLFAQYGERVWKRIKRMKPATLGNVAASGRGTRVDGKGEPVTDMPTCHGTTLYNVHCSTWLGKYEDGISLLREIARTAIIAEMSDMLTP